MQCELEVIAHKVGEVQDTQSASKLWHVLQQQYSHCRLSAILPGRLPLVVRIDLDFGNVVVKLLRP